MLAPKQFPSVVLFLSAMTGLVAAAPSDFDIRVSNSPQVVINELHVNPDVKTELVEYVELHNPGTAEVDLSGWRLDGGVFYTFAAGQDLPAGGYMIVAEDPTHIRAKWGVGPVPCLGQSLLRAVRGQAGQRWGSGRAVRCPGQVVDEVEYQLGFPWPTVGDAVPGTSTGTGYSMQLTNPLFDNNLGGSWRSGSPTPAAVNKLVFAANIPPADPAGEALAQGAEAGEAVTVTAKVTDPDGVKTVTLMYQVVNPGSYISPQDPQYITNWTSVAMHDDGLERRRGDAGRHLHGPASRLAAEAPPAGPLQDLRDGRLGASVTVPYADDPQPNFAYFVYDGVPAWRGAVQPGVTAGCRVPRRGDEQPARLSPDQQEGRRGGMHVDLQGRQRPSSAGRARSSMTARSTTTSATACAAASGATPWGRTCSSSISNRGHYFQARDDYGNKYETKWNTMNFSACIQQGGFGSAASRACSRLRRSGCSTWWAAPPPRRTGCISASSTSRRGRERNAAHAPLTTKGTQYDGDFWGLYMTIEQMDGRFLDEHGLPDGNLYKMDSGA